MEVVQFQYTCSHNSKIVTTSMPSRCVVAGCSGTPDSTKGIVFHKIPAVNDERPAVQRRCKKWAGFVKQKCPKWEPT